MKDETYVFIQDVREKGSTARSARNRRTHNGKGGRVKFPSDNLSRKELQAMNGEVKSYRLNEPMTWNEFKEMPDDIKVTYIKLLRKRFDVPDSKIGEMMGASKDMVSHLFIRLGLRNGVKRGKRKNWDIEGWLAFVNGVPIPAADPVKEDPEDVKQPVEETPEAERQFVRLEDICEPVPVPEIPPLSIHWKEKKMETPCSGSLNFEGRAEDVLNTVSVILGGADVRITIAWEVCD